MKLKKLFTFTFCAVLMFSLVACISHAKYDVETDTTLQPASPFQPCDTMEDAEKIAGFDLTLPHPADQLEAEENEMIQAFYGEDGSDMLIRKALGSEDISGDYNEYTHVKTVDDVTLKGDSCQFSLALWTDGAYTYSISVKNALPQDEMMTLVHNTI